jgi:hypothetical protein
MNKTTGKLLKQIANLLFSTADNIERKQQPIVFAVLTGLAVIIFTVATVL